EGSVAAVSCANEGVRFVARLARLASCAARNAPSRAPLLRQSRYGKGWVPEPTPPAGRLKSASRDASDMPTTMIGLAVTLAFSLVAFTMPTSVWAAGPMLTVSADGSVHTFDRDALLARTDVVEITTS